jgi:membrane associated rhomboid family serine protease
MFPIRDENPTIHRPWMTMLLIAANVGVGMRQLTLSSSETSSLFAEAALIPARLTGLANAPGIAAPLTLLTSQFLHGGLLHLLGNMLFLWIFGNNVEDILRPARFLLFYLACGVVAGLVHVATQAASLTPTVGASGAISGILGAYAVMFPKARIHTVVLLVFYITVVPVPALVWVAIWLGLQLLNAAAVSGGPGGGVAWFAHIGGLIAGVALLPLLRPRRPPHRSASFLA